MNTQFSLLRNSALEAKVPIISLNTESFLYEYVSKHHIKHIVEIGSAIGYSTSILADAIHSRQGTIHSREISYPHYYQALKNTQHYKNVTIYLGNVCLYNVDMILQKNTYDLFFIDARKSETLSYLKLLGPYIQTTSHIIIDDAIKFKSKMKDCYDFLDKNQIEYTLHQLDSDDGILVIQGSEQFLQALSSL